MNLTKDSVVDTKLNEVGRFPYFLFLAYNIFKKHHGHENIEFKINNSYIPDEKFESLNILVEEVKDIIDLNDLTGRDFEEKLIEDVLLHITVFYPIIVIKNSVSTNNNGHTLRNVFFRATFQKNRGLNASLYRTLLSRLEFSKNYLHSHAHTSQFDTYSPFCLGNGPIKSTGRDFTHIMFDISPFTGQTTDSFILIANKFRIEMDELLKVESEAGGPYQRYHRMIESLGQVKYNPMLLEHYKASSVPVSEVQHFLSNNRIFETVMNNCEVILTQERDNLTKIELLPNLLALSRALENIGLEISNSRNCYLNINDIEHEKVFVENFRDWVAAEDQNETVTQKDIFFKDKRMSLRIISNNKYFSIDTPVESTLIKVHNPSYMYKIVMVIEEYCNLRLTNNQILEDTKLLKQK